MSAYFVTATGTDIGKTYVTAGLLRVLRAEGALALKPVVSGFSAGNAAASDPGVLLTALGRPVTPETLEGISPWRFEAPLSPDMAAAREGRSIDFEALLGFCREAIARARGPLFIEGVGGVMVPLDGCHTVRDWMVALDLPLVLVTGTYLGAISHTLTALDAVAHAGLSVTALVVNESAESPVTPAETIATLGHFVRTAPTTFLPRGAGDADFRRLWRTFGRMGMP
jgi:dethiobiotin synthetase